MIYNRQIFGVFVKAFRYQAMNHHPLTVHAHTTVSVPRYAVQTPCLCVEDSSITITQYVFEDRVGTDGRHFIFGPKKSFVVRPKKKYFLEPNHKK